MQRSFRTLAASPRERSLPVLLPVPPCGLGPWCRAFARPRLDVSLGPYLPRPLLLTLPAPPSGTTEGRPAVGRPSPPGPAGPFLPQSSSPSRSRPSLFRGLPSTSAGAQVRGSDRGQQVSPGSGPETTPLTQCRSGVPCRICECSVSIPISRLWRPPRVPHPPKSRRVRSRPNRSICEHLGSNLTPPQRPCNLAMRS